MIKFNIKTIIEINIEKKIKKIFRKIEKIIFTVIKTGWKRKSTCFILKEYVEKFFQAKNSKYSTITSYSFLIHLSTIDQTKQKPFITDYFWQILILFKSIIYNINFRSNLKFQILINERQLELDRLRIELEALQREESEQKEYMQKLFSTTSFSWSFFLFIEIYTLNPYENTQLIWWNVQLQLIEAAIFVI